MLLSSLGRGLHLFTADVLVTMSLLGLHDISVVFFRAVIDADIYVAPPLGEEPEISFSNCDEL